MEIGIVGLGRMGAGMARRLARAGVHVICYDQADAARRSVAAEPNVVCAENLAALCARLSGERVVILMLPAGGAVEDTIRDFLPLLSAGDTPKSIEIFAPFAKILSADPDLGWLHCGPSGAGHYAKMIHNGIEYGMMQALAEGFALIAARPELDIDAGRLAETWRHGSVVRCWLVDW